MLILRKTDFYIETAILILLFISIPVLYAYGFLTGLFALGIIQLLSAGLNTKAFVHKALKAEIKRYWVFTGSILLILFAIFLSPREKGSAAMDITYILHDHCHLLSYYLSKINKQY